MDSGRSNLQSIQVRGKRIQPPRSCLRTKGRQILRDNTKSILLWNLHENNKWLDNERRNLVLPLPMKTLNPKWSLLRLTHTKSKPHHPWKQLSKNRKRYQKISPKKSRSESSAVKKDPNWTKKLLSSRRDPVSLFPLFPTKLRGSKKLSW